MPKYNTKAYKFDYDEEALVATGYIKTFAPSGHYYTLDNVMINFSTGWTGTLYIDHIMNHGTGWNTTFEYTVSGNVWLNDLDIPCAEDDTIKLTLDGGEFTGTVYSRVGYDTELMQW